jgi:hypothetical protein
MALCCQVNSCTSAGLSPNQLELLHHVHVSKACFHHHIMHDAAHSICSHCVQQTLHASGQWNSHPYACMHVGLWLFHMLLVSMLLVQLGPSLLIVTCPRCLLHRPLHTALPSQLLLLGCCARPAPSGQRAPGHTRTALPATPAAGLCAAGSNRREHQQLSSC